MSVREPLRMRKALLAGVVALALTGAGVGDRLVRHRHAFAHAVPVRLREIRRVRPRAIGQSGQRQGRQGPAPAASAWRKRGEEGDGTFETLLTQQGTVDAVSETSVTVKSEDGFTQSYAVNAETKIISSRRLRQMAPRQRATTANGLSPQQDHRGHRRG